MTFWHLWPYKRFSTLFCGNIKDFLYQIFQVIIVANTGRCGSTLLAQMFEAVEGGFLFLSSYKRWRWLIVQLICILSRCSNPQIHPNPSTYYSTTVLHLSLTLFAFTIFIFESTYIESYHFLLFQYTNLKDILGQTVLRCQMSIMLSIVCLLLSSLGEIGVTNENMRLEQKI